MLTLRELGLLGRDTLALWARFFPVIAGWFALGYGIRLMSMQLAVIVGGWAMEKRQPARSTCSPGRSVAVTMGVCWL